MHRNIAILFLLVLPACWSQNEAEEGVYVSIDISQSRAHVGDEVTLVCRIANMPPDGFIYWFKTVMAQGEDLVDLIASSTQPLPPYDIITRMEFNSVSSGTSKLFTLKIKGVTEEDSGHYGCSYREMSDNVYETEIFDVYSQVDNITVSVDGQPSGYHGLEVTADEPVQLEIWAGNSVPAPVLYVYVDDVDITRELSYATTTHVRCEGAQPSKTCPLHYVRSAKAFGSYTFNGNQDGSRLTVKAKVTGSGFDIFNKSLPITVNHSPLFKCFTQQHAIRSHNYTLTCLIHARPAADVFYWRLTGDRGEVLAVPGRFVSGWNALASVQDEGKVASAVSLTLYNVTDYHYTRYELVVGNEIGNNSLNLTLFEEFTPTHGPSSASLCTPTVIMTSLAFICAALTRTRYDA